MLSPEIALYAHGLPKMQGDGLHSWTSPGEGLLVHFQALPLFHKQQFVFVFELDAEEEGLGPM